MTVDLFTGGKARGQTVLTPPSIVAGLERFWPGGIDLDPCSCEGSLVPTRERLYEKQDGLKAAWRWRYPTDHDPNVFVNEPFNDLKAWLDKCRREAELGCHIVNLCPWRSRRPWFRAAYKTAAAVLLLDPVTFYDASTGQPWRSKSGQVTQFPENCCLLYWGPEREAFFAAFAELGDPL